MELTGKRVAMLVENLYEDLELWYPLLRLREAGAEVTTVGNGATSYTSKHGYPAKADTSVDHVSAADFDAVIMPGGYAPDHMRRSQAMVDLVREAVQQGKIVAAICHAGWMLASANVIRRKRVTGFFSVKDDLTNAGGIYEDKEVVRDDNLITSRMPTDLPAFCSTLIQAMAEANVGASVTTG
jgi:protease I